ncbi:GntR family transcriptional regulator [Paraburkholderia sediminicola]|uniref:GntR family transcriptional regulator n=1 Tax=Paraburkholderia sp. D1E TaxID=3461398 RepID=UPI000EB038F7
MEQENEWAAAEEVAFGRISVNRALDEIANQIRQEVMAGRLKPGQKLPAERDLCERFGVSRNTLREALRALEVTGLIELKKGAKGGAFIKSGDREVVVKALCDLYYLGSVTPEQLTEARLMLSDSIVRSVCRKATESDIQALRDNVALAEAAHEAGDYAGRSLIHLQFHLLLAQISGNPIIMLTMAAILEVVTQYVKVIGPGDNRFVIPSRRRLIKLIEERDEDEAAKELASHLKRIHRFYLSKVSSSR